MFVQVDLIIRGGTCVSHRGVMPADVAVRDGIIVAIGNFDDLKAENTIDASGLHLLPGVIDSEFHVSQYFVNDTRAALKGGITTILAVPEQEIAVGDDFYCDFGYFEQATLENIDQLAELENTEGCAGICLSMAATGHFSSITDDKTILRALKNGRRRVVVHAEDQDRLNARLKYQKLGDVSSHPVWRDEKQALEATRRILAIARGAGRPVHLQHVSTDKELALIAAYKDIATAALIPPHLFLSAPDCYDHFREYAKIDPPIRTEDNRQGLWKALTNSIVDILASGHNPQTIAEKDKAYSDCPSGCPAVQTMIPLMLDQVNKGSLSIEHLADLTSASPAKIFNIAGKGRIAVGYDADFTLVDLKKEWGLDDNDVESVCGWDLHAGCDFIGCVSGTIIRGQQVMWQGNVMGDAIGEPIQYHDTFVEYEPE